MAQTVIIRGQSQRDIAKRLIDAAPMNAIVTVKEATRTNEQSALMWALLSDVSRAKPAGRRQVPEMWKALFMKACGHHVQFLEGLDGEPFPVGFRSSLLTVRQMADLITFILAWGDENGVAWSQQQVAA